MKNEPIDAMRTRMEVMATRRQRSLLIYLVALTVLILGPFGALMLAIAYRIAVWS